MIVKTMSKKSGVKQLISYLFKDKDKLENEHFSPMVVKHNLTGHDKARWAKQYEFNHSLRRQKRVNNNVAYHTVLSFHPHERDLLNKKILKDFANQYINLNGRDKMYLITAHVEKTNHVHLHVMVSGSTYLTGQASRLSKKEFQKLKEDLEKYQRERYPQLKDSLVHSGQKVRGKELTNSRQSNKKELKQLLESNLAKANNLESFIDNLKAKGYEPYYRSQRLTGVKNKDEIKFRLSSLGISKDQIEDLETKSNEQQKALDELQGIRDSARGNSRENNSRDRFSDNEQEADQEAELDENELEPTDDYER